MKSTGILACVAAITLFAAGNAFAKSDKGYTVDAGIGFWLNAENGGSKKNMDGTFKAMGDNALSVEVKGNQTSGGFTFGTIQYDSSFNAVDGSKQTLGSVTGNGSTSINLDGSSTIANSANSATFAKDTIVGFWVEYNGQTYYSNILGKDKDPFSRTDANDGSADIYFGTKKNGALGYGNADIILSIGGSVTPSGGTSGAPLPGVLVTLAIAGGIGGYLKRRKAKH